MNYYSHHIGDYMTDTAHLSILEDGSYRRLMDRYYTTEAPLIADEVALFRLIRARSEDEKEAVRVVLTEFFIMTDAGWAHKRCESEIEAFKEKSGKAADAANKRWGKSSSASSALPAQPGANSPVNANAMPTQCERIPDAMHTQEPITNNHKPLSSKAEAAPEPSQGQAKAEPKQKTATAARLPADWLPSIDDEKFCRDTRPDLTPIAVADRFRDFWIAQPGVKGKKLDWSATWRNWVRNERPSSGQARAGPAWQSANEKTKSWCDQLLGINTNEQHREFIDITPIATELG